MKQISILIIVINMAISSFAQHKDSSRNYPALLDAYMNAAVNVNQFSGSVLVTRKGNIIYQKTFGTLDFCNEHPLDSNSAFQLGMLTEEFTAAAILMLKDENKLQLTDPITKYFPELPYNTVTIKHLLTHTSGLPDYYDVMKGKWGIAKAAANSDIIKRLANTKIPLAWQPGTRYDEYHYYTDYPLLASIIEKISGQSYADFMQQYIFEPLHLQHTKVIIQSNKSDDVNQVETVYFDESKQQFLPADSFKYFPPEDDSISTNIVGGKGISSTAHDLFLWNKALKNHTFFSAATQQEMFTPYILKDTASKIFMGYGVLTGANEFGNYVQQRDYGNNETLGFLTTLIQYKKNDISIIILANKSKPSSNISGSLAYIMFNSEVVPPYIHKAIEIDTSLLDKYEGTYEVPYIIHAYKKDNTLWITMLGEPDLKLLPESPTKFFSSSKEYDLQVEFKTDNTGKIANTYFINNGLKKEVKRL